LKVLTCEIHAGNKHRTSYRNLVKTLQRLYDIYYSVGDRRKIEVRDFHMGLEGSHSDMIHYESVHAKIILIDGLKCYAGSGEWRLNLLYNNFELGVLLKGDLIAGIEEAFDLVWTHAKPVTYDYLRDTTKWKDGSTRVASTYQRDKRWNRKKIRHRCL
jgi:phosphatidylserine/phosphatidylglycerophosphate/cardiolipin synthase-like enzyme